MRTTIRLDDHLLTQAKRLAAERRKTLTSLIEDALRQVLAERKLARTRRRVRLPVFGGKLKTGIDLDDSASLLDRMEDHDGPR
jgi:hypothetical protein